MSIATNAWPQVETDPQRLALLAAADRLLTGTPKHSTGRLSVVQLAIEAKVKYWIVAQKHTDLRDHFQRLASQSRRDTSKVASSHNPLDDVTRERDDLREHNKRLEQLITLYGTAIKELAVENAALRDQASMRVGTVTPLPLRTRDRQHP